MTIKHKGENGESGRLKKITLTLKVKTVITQNLDQYTNSRHLCLMWLTLISSQANKLSNLGSAIIK